MTSVRRRYKSGKVLHFTAVKTGVFLNNLEMLMISHRVELFRWGLSRLSNVLKLKSEKFVVVVNLDIRR